MCLCYCWMVVLVWESQCRLENDCFQCGTFPHYSLPLSFQSGPALLQLAAQIFIFVYILHGHTNSKVLSVWCFTSSFKPLCLLNAIFQLDCGLKQVVGQELPNTYVFRSFLFFFPFFTPSRGYQQIYIRRHFVCLHWCTMSVSSRPLVGGAVVLAKSQGEQLPCKKVNKWFSICVASDGGSVHCSIKESPQENKMYSLSLLAVLKPHMVIYWLFVFHTYIFLQNLPLPNPVEICPHYI